MSIPRTRALCVSFLVASVVGLAPHAAEASATGIFKNCTAYNQTWPHGVGKNNAHDHTSGTPVTNFKHSTVKYNRAMSHNKGLDRDGDGIACEKK